MNSLNSVFKSIFISLSYTLCFNDEYSFSHVWWICTASFHNVIFFFFTNPKYKTYNSNQPDTFLKIFFSGATRPHVVPNEFFFLFLMAELRLQNSIMVITRMKLSRGVIAKLCGYTHKWNDISLYAFNQFLQLCDLEY